MASDFTPRRTPRTVRREEPSRLEIATRLACTFRYDAEAIEGDGSRLPRIANVCVRMADELIRAERASRAGGQS